MKAMSSAMFFWLMDMAVVSTLLPLILATLTRSVRAAPGNPLQLLLSCARRTPKANTRPRAVAEAQADPRHHPRLVLLPRRQLLLLDRRGRAQDRPHHEAWEVGPEVSNVRNNRPELMERVAHHA